MTTAKKSFLSGPLAVVMIILLAGCSGSNTEAVESPTEAAVQVEEVFKQAPPAMKASAETASEALRAGDYEKAIETLYTVRQEQEVTMEQGMAIQRAMVAMETDLMRRVEAGDEKAVRAYELLRKRNRN